MSHRKTLSGLFVAPLIVAAIAAPAASAMPMREAVQKDMHASTVVKPDAQKQDLRGEATIGATGQNPQTHTPSGQDLRGEAAADKPAPEAPAGLPTWPVDPKPIVPVTQEPVATTGGDDGIEWPLSGILLAGALLLGGTLGVAGAHFRVRQSHA